MENKKVGGQAALQDEVLAVEMVDRQVFDVAAALGFSQDEWWVEQMEI